MRQVIVCKTAEELGIRQWERAGLQALIGPFRRGEFSVDMTEYEKRTERGIARCIGGWLAVVSGLDPEPYVSRYRHTGCALGKLYSPERYDDPRDGRVAARAVRTFLVTGDPGWRTTSGSDAFFAVRELYRTCAADQVPPRLGPTSVPHLLKASWS